MIVSLRRRWRWHLRPLLEDTPERARMMADLKETRRGWLCGRWTAIRLGRVCDAAVELLGSR